MKHYILTRWNQSHNNENIYNFKGINDPERCMYERVVLFEKYCLPSIHMDTIIVGEEIDIENIFLSNE
jgi:hypothetical protein